MKLFHASDMAIVEPDIGHSRKNVDFGCGFYTTSIYDQACKWCERFKRRGKNAVISHYIFDEQAAATLKTLSFDSYSDEWLDFILKCRSGKDTADYEIVMGGVANDKAFNTVELYYDGLIECTEAIRRLRFEKPNMQICFRTERAIHACLRFEGSEQL